MIKEKLWSINTKGPSGVNPVPEIVMGVNDKYESVIGIDGKELNANDIEHVKLGKERIVNSDNLKKKKNYLYEITIQDLDYENAKAAFKMQAAEQLKYGCSAFRNGDFVGRNFDWTYNQDAMFVVHIPAAYDRYQSVSVCGGSGMEDLNESVATSRKYSSDYDILPFKALDGVNEKGLFAEINVVAVDKGISQGTKPLIEKREEISIRMIVRYVLDHFATAQEAVEYLQNYVSVYPTTETLKVGYDIHCFIADHDHTYILEIVDDQLIATCADSGSNSNIAGYPIMTNFYVNDIILNDDGKVYTPETQDETHNAMDTNHITQFGCGLERWNKIVDGLDNVTDKDSTLALLQAIKYTNTYDLTNKLYTEFVEAHYIDEDGKIKELTVKSTPEQYENSNDVQLTIYAYEHRSRDPQNPCYGTWQSTHSACYDLANKRLYIAVQEDYNNVFEFGLEAINTQMPLAPTADGNYILKCTVSDGDIIYTWESVGE